MQTSEFIVRGDGAESLPEAYDDIADKNRADYEGEDFTVVTTEKYYLRTNSNLQATTVFEMVEPDACKVAIHSGGGGSGILQATLGSEATEASRLSGKITSYCERHDLEIEDPSP